MSYQFNRTGVSFAFIDNYNELSGMSIKESFKVGYSHFAAAIVIGLVAYVFFLIPLLGIIVTPFLCAVGTTTYMFYSEKRSKLQTL